MSGSLGNNLRKHVLRVRVDGVLSQRQLGTLAGTAAKRRHEELINDGVVPATFIRVVDGVVGAQETAIKISPNHPGVIEYRGSSLVQAAAFALAKAQEISPRARKQGGDYAKAWAIFADGKQVDGADAIPPGTQEVIVVNFVPYARRLEQAFGRHFNLPYYMVTSTVTDAAKRAFSGLDIRRRFVTLAGVFGSHWEVPYQLRKPPGGQVLYPAIVISERPR